ncbi:MAG: helix-turn-helix transcriptional regulator [Anaerolineae bacterium]|nr:helix-turn-helix transcriptional regulator [Anaerolineae bacterium]
MAQPNFLGKRLKKRRVELGLTLRQLAEMTSLTPSFISQLERGMTTPSLNSIQRLADALKVPFMFFISEEGQSTLRVTRAGHRRKVLVEDVHTSYELLSPDLTTGFEGVLIRLDPGARSAVRRLPVETEELFFVMEGHLVVGIGEEEITLDPGDSVQIFGSMLNYIHCAGETPVTYIAVISPPVL